MTLFNFILGTTQLNLTTPDNEEGANPMSLQTSRKETLSNLEHATAIMLPKVRKPTVGEQRYDNWKPF